MGGNQTIEKVTKNALNGLHVCGLDNVPCAQGQEHALMSVTVACPEIHGNSGLDTKDDSSFPEHDLKPVEGKAVNVMAKAILEAPRKVKLLATGRLTNVALLLSMYPEAMGNIDEIIIMGGALRGGNTHPVAEFNIQGDPEAAQIIFNHGLDENAPLQDVSKLCPSQLRVPVVLVPLEVTHTVLVSDEILKRIEALRIPSLPDKPCKFTKLAISLLLFFSHTYKEVFRFNHGPPLHDPVAVYYALNRKAFESKTYRVDVECTGVHSRGQTVVDIWEQTKRPRNVRVCEKVDVDAFWNDMIAAIHKVALKRVLKDE